MRRTNRQFENPKDGKEMKTQSLTHMHARAFVCVAVTSSKNVCLCAIVVVVVVAFFIRFSSSGDSNSMWFRRWWWWCSFILIANSPISSLYFHGIRNNINVIDRLQCNVRVQSNPYSTVECIARAPMEMKIHLRQQILLYLYIVVIITIISEPNVNCELWNSREKTVIISNCISLEWRLWQRKSRQQTNGFHIFMEHRWHEIDIFVDLFSLQIFLFFSILKEICFVRSNRRAKDRARARAHRARLVHTNTRTHIFLSLILCAPATASRFELIFLFLVSSFVFFCTSSIRLREFDRHWHNRSGLLTPTRSLCDFFHSFAAGCLIWSKTMWLFLAHGIFSNWQFSSRNQRQRMFLFWFLLLFLWFVRCEQLSCKDVHNFNCTHNWQQSQKRVCVCGVRVQWQNAMQNKEENTYIGEKRLSLVDAFRFVCHFKIRIEIISNISSIVSDSIHLIGILRTFFACMFTFLSSDFVCVRARQLKRAI